MNNFETITDLLDTVTGGAPKGQAPAAQPDLYSVLREQLGPDSSAYQTMRPAPGGKVQFQKCLPLKNVAGAAFCTDVGQPQTLPTMPQ
jgi:hypothetical protein